MSNVRSIETPRPEPDEEVIGRLETLLEQAKSGELQRIAYVTETQSGGYVYGTGGGVTITTLGTVALLKNFVANTLEEHIEDL